MRVAVGVEYDGRGFHGWESQARGRTVQSALELALSRVADAPVRTVCAGRTDARVHGLAQVAHFDTGAERSDRAWVFGANSNLPKDVSVLWSLRAAPDFHARFSATARHYRYVILNRPMRPAALHGRVAWECRALDATRMAAAAATLLGEHDFSAFRAAGCQARSPVRTVHRLDVTRDGDFVLLEVSANAFLQHMVRNLAGVLMAIGMGRQPIHWARQVLEGRDRRRGGVTAPPDGLYFTGVDYPVGFGIPRLSPRIALW
jgi:tRNA pseudouridine38-40 synthase